MEIITKYIFFSIWIIFLILLKLCWCCIKLASDTLLNALSKYFLEGNCINLSAAASLFTHSKRHCQPEPTKSGAEGWPLQLPPPWSLGTCSLQLTWFASGSLVGKRRWEELPGVFGHGVSASQTVACFFGTYLRVINNRELLCNPNLDTLWKSRKKYSGKSLWFFFPSTHYSRCLRISSQDGGLPLCAAWSPLQLQPPSLAALPLRWEACPNAWQNANKCFAAFFFSFPITFKFQQTTSRNLMNLHDKKIPKIYRALLGFGLGFDYSSKSLGIL